MNKREVGAWQEQRVCEYLMEAGYKILEHNYRCRLGEIDIIARHKGYLVFVEVKYRKNEAEGTPEEAVNLRKQRKISKVAAWYMNEKGLDIYTPVRFDVAAATPEEIRIHENAFDYQYL
ncbi:MAG: YraN family protein [Clostridia bacterium]|nr:YraN family protein [Clostridia bacterium]NCC44336.1 YraN family protein [Clostridia bacterium]